MKAIFRVLSVFFFVLFLSGQSQSQAVIPKGGGTSTATRPGSIQDSNPMEYWSDMEASARADGALFGKVIASGDAFLWEPIPVIITCKGAAESASQTDSSGHFLIRPAKISGELGVQGDTKRQMEVRYEGCVVSASLIGFDSTEITITHRNLREDPDLGTITLKRKSGGASSSSGSRESIPPAALKSFDKARAQLIDQKPDHAQKELEKAVQIYPQFAEAWYQLGRLQAATDSQSAHESFTKAAAADTSFVSPYEQLAAMAIQGGKWKEALENTSHILQIEPAGTPQIWYFDALAKVQLGQVDAARTSALKALSMDPLHQVTSTEQLLGVIFTLKKDYPTALEHLRSCLTYLPPGPKADTVKRQIAQVEHLETTAK
jgi:Tetratricopeptide repeat